MLFTLKSTINYFAERGSSVLVASLDISKAYDSANHFKLYSSLLHVGTPIMIIDGGRLSLLSAKPAAVFPAAKHRRLSAVQVILLGDRGT